MSGVTDSIVLQRHGYKRLREIGSGTYGVVLKVLHEQSGVFYATKKIKSEGGEGVSASALREISILRLLEHPNIVILHEIISSGPKVFLVLECLAGDFKKILNAIDVIPLELAKCFMYQILKGIEYTHENRILHRDLKPQNLLVSNDGVIKLADFGLARAGNVKYKQLTHEVVTLWYRCPEILLGCEVYEQEVDMWSLGTIFVEILTGTPFLTGDSEIDQLYKIFRARGTPTDLTMPGFSKLRFHNACFPIWKGVPMRRIL
eukprot:UN30152